MSHSISRFDYSPTSTPSGIAAAAGLRAPSKHHLLRPTTTAPTPPIPTAADPFHLNAKLLSDTAERSPPRLQLQLSPTSMSELTIQRHRAATTFSILLASNAAAAGGGPHCQHPSPTVGILQRQQVSTTLRHDVAASFCPRHRAALQSPTSTTALDRPPAITTFHRHPPAFAAPPTPTSTLRRPVNVQAPTTTPPCLRCPPLIETPPSRTSPSSFTTLVCNYPSPSPVPFEPPVPQHSCEEFDRL